MTTMLTLQLLTLFVAIGGELEAVEIRPRGEISRHDYAGLLIASPRPTVVAVDLDLGQDVAGYVVKLLGVASGDRRFRVQWQFENAMTVMDEGPHVDLLGWKRYTSPWTILASDEEGHLVLPRLTEAQREQLPDVTMEELVRAVEAQAGTRWADHARTASAPGAYPTGVATSAYRVRVERDFGGGHWSTLVTVELRFPMGC